MMVSQTIIVSNRLPVSVKKTEGGLEVYPSAGGLATGLSSYANKRGNLWIGWPGLVSDDLTEKDKQNITKKLAAYNCRPVFLTQKQLDDYYNGYSNSILWPFLHTMETDFAHEARYWRAYREVNELFCEAILSLSNPGSTVWLHDYQLLLLPKMLREHRPNDSIGFFLHIPFPSALHFSIINHSSSLIKGMLGANLIGFHTKQYAQNFLDSCHELGIGTPTDDGLALKERAVRVADFPMGIDYIKFSHAYRTHAVQKELKRLQRKYKDRKVILTVDRLDPTKGFIERLQAYQTLLGANPSLHRNVVMVMLAIPSRDKIDAYRKLKTDVEKLVSAINTEFGTLGWKPVEYMYKSVPFEQLSALYQIADVAFVAPIKDGMNLVAKEYVASQGAKKGILILSETAGAAQELNEALLVNPARPKSLVKALKRAVKMPPRELKRRVVAMQKVLSTNTVHDWAGNFMTTLDKSSNVGRIPLLTPLRIKNLLGNYSLATKRLIIFDYDGVLAPFAGKPDDASPTVKLLKQLEKISRQPNTTLAIISGRGQVDLEKWLGKLHVVLAAEHGAIIRWPGQDWQALAKPSTDWKEDIEPLLQEYARDTPGAFVEEKAYSLVWHYREASPYHAQKNITLLKSILKPLLRIHGVQLFRGNKILEIKSPGVHKGTAIKSLLVKPYDFILALGDDYTDEDMFRALPYRAYTIKVGRGKTHARYRMPSTSEVEKLLDRF